MYIFITSIQQLCKIRYKECFFNDIFYRLEHQMMFTKKMQYLLYTCVSINNCFMSIGPRLLFSIFD